MNRNRTIILVRHGERADIPSSPSTRSALRSNPPLTERGHLQARKIADRLAGCRDISNVYSSPFERAIQTALPIGGVLGLRVRIELGISEILAPEFFPTDPCIETLVGNASVYESIDRQYFSVHIPQYPEDWSECIRRCGLTVSRLLDQTGEDLVVVGHWASVVATCIALTADPRELDCPFGSITSLRERGARWELETDSDTAHLA